MSPAALLSLKQSFATHEVEPLAESVEQLLSLPNACRLREELTKLYPERKR